MNNVLLWFSGVGVLVLGIQLFVIFYDVLCFVVVFDQQLVGWEDFGVYFCLFCGVWVISGVLQFRGDGGGIYWYYVGLYYVSQGDFLCYFVVGVGSVNYGKYFIIVGDSGDSWEGYVDVGDGFGDNQCFMVGCFYCGDEFWVISGVNFIFMGDVFCMWCVFMNFWDQWIVWFLWYGGGCDYWDFGK